MVVGIPRRCDAEVVRSRGRTRRALDRVHRARRPDPVGHRPGVRSPLAGMLPHTFSQGHELAQRGATAIAITPGWLRSEMMLDNYGSLTRQLRVTELNWRDALAPNRVDGYPTAPDEFVDRWRSA